MRRTQAKSVLWIVDKPRDFDELAGTLETDGHQVIVESEMSKTVPWLDRDVIDLVLFDNAFARDRISFPPFQEAFLKARERARSRGQRLRMVSFEEPIEEMMRRSIPFLVDGPDGIEGHFDVHKIVRSLVSHSDGVLPSESAPADARDALRVAFRKTSDEVLRWFANNPSALPGMHWRDFEHLVAELFDRNGFEVTLTSSSGDHGADLYAARHTKLGILLYVVECKRHRLNRPVGPSPVRGLRGVIDRDGANAGLLVTTSFFSEGAWIEQRTIPFRVSLHDNRDLRRWLCGSPIF
jgi:hypothetical protein